MSANAAAWRWKQLGAGLLMATSLLIASRVNAHLMSAGLGVVNVRERDAVVLIGVPVAAFEGVDDDGDGLLQPSEIKAHRTEILEQLARTFHLTVGGNVASVREAHLMVSVHAEGGSGAPQLEWWGLLDFEPPEKSTECTEVGLQWFDGISQQAQDTVYTLQIHRAGGTHTAIISQAHPRYWFGCEAEIKVGSH